MDTQVTDISFGVNLSEKLKKRDPHIGEMSIILSLRKCSTTLNAATIQLSKIS